MLVFQQMCIFFCLMLLGLLARRKEILNDSNQKQISSLVINIAYPAIMLSGVSREGTRIEGKELIFAFSVAVAVLLSAVFLGQIVPRILGYERKYYGIINVMTVFTNIGFMGIPMIYGADTSIYMTIFLIPFNILFLRDTDNLAVRRRKEKISSARTYKCRNRSLCTFSHYLFFRSSFALCTKYCNTNVWRTDCTFCNDAYRCVVAGYSLEVFA